MEHNDLKSKFQGSKQRTGQRAGREKRKDVGEPAEVEGVQLFPLAPSAHRARLAEVKVRFRSPEGNTQPLQRMCRQRA